MKFSAVGGEESDVMAALHARAFDKAWSSADIAKMLENPAVNAVIAYDDSDPPNPQGFVMAWVAAGDGEILTLAVAPEARRHGIGAALVNAACAGALVRGAGTLHLEVAENNTAARALYAKLKFEEVGRRAAYYAGEGGAVDALVLRRALPRPLV